MAATLKDHVRWHSEDNRLTEKLFQPLLSVLQFTFGWGKPPQIVTALLDCVCPICGAREGLGEYQLDKGYNDDGKCFGARCGRCGWSF